MSINNPIPDEDRIRETEEYTRDREYFYTLLSDADKEMLPEGDVWGIPEETNSFSVTSGLEWDGIKTFIEKNSLDADAFFDAVFAYVLSRFTGKSEALYTTVCNEQQIPVFCRIDTDQSIADFINAIKAQLLQSASCNHCSFAEILKDNEISQDVLFVYRGDRRPDRTEDGTKAFLKLEVFMENNQVIFECIHRSDRFSEVFIRQIIECIQKGLEEFTKKNTLNEVSLLTDEAISKMDAFNAETQKDYPVRDIVSMFRETAAKYGDKPAVLFKDVVFTYSQFDDLSERIACHLREHGIGKGDVVSFLIPRCEWMPVIAIGILKSGAAYQPLDPTYPKERLSFMIKDADCKLLIADADLVSLIPEYSGPVLCTKDIASLPKGEKISDHPAPEDMVILLYTSGSTGVPKGVILEHHNICNLCYWAWDLYGVDENSRSASYASFGFDATLLDMYPVITCGGRICIVEEEIRLDLLEMEKWFNRHEITHSVMTTQVARQFYTSAGVPSLRYMMAGGEKLVPVKPDPDGPILINGYGPSECTVLCSGQIVDKLYERIPVGKPISNVKLYVVDANMKRLPPFMPGELIISGRGVGRGYLNRPEQTEKAFVRNPFSDDPDYVKAYRTGDVVRLLPNGSYDFIGRQDGQVKVRGFRIELTEIEGIIREFEGIKDATVQAFEDSETGEKFIAAYVVSDNDIDVEAMNNFILERKPPYMVPAVTMQIPAIPLNQNQKVNKKALPKPDRKAAIKRNNVGEAAPLNILEQELKDIISEIVGMTDFGITDNFRNIGLTSISGIRLAVQLQKKYGIQVDVRELAAVGTIQAVENEILSALMNKKEEPVKETKTVKKAPEACRLSFAQQGVYTECQVDPESVRYNLPMALRFPGEISTAQLEEAVRRMVEAHSYILCRFIPGSDNEIVQEPIPDFKIDIPVKEMSASEFETYKESFVRPFDLEKGPCVRFEIIKADTVILLMDMHHLISDGASVDIFIEGLCEALDGTVPEKESYDYYDFTADERIAPETEEFFAKRMEMVEEATEIIPDVFEEGLPHTEKNVSADTEFAPVRDYAKKAGVTPAGVYLAAVYIASGRYVCEDMVSIATIANGRNNLKVANTLGMFVNTLPLVMDIDHKEKTKDFIKRVAENFSDTIDNEHYPFARIAAKYDFHPRISYAYQLGVLSEYKTKYGRVEVESLESDIAKLPVSIFIDGTEDAARIQIAYDSSMYSEEMMRGFAKSIDNAVKGLISKESLSEISLTDEEQWKVLDGFNKAWDLEYNDKDTAVSVFKRNVKEMPDKTAAVYKDKAFTYKELDELSDILAIKIYKKACEITGKTDLAEEVAALLLHRNENVFLLPLAVLKAGLAYEPMDPSYPKERLNFMVKDANACMLIADDDLKCTVDEYEGNVITVSELEKTDPDGTLPVGPKPEDMFIMLYTSGSTGTPKGCQLEHRNLVSYAHGVRNDFYTKDDRIAAYASFGFDVNMSDVFCTLLNGGTVYLIPEDIRMDLGALAAYFDEVGITALLLTTQVGVQFLLNYPKLRTLRMLVMGGEKLPAVNPEKLSYTIVNGYGPTENCCGVSLFPIRAWEPNIPIGKPMSTIHGYILDKTGHRLPVGAAGEYCLSGPQVSRGYLNRPDKTAEAYEDCPFNDFRMYHTGDIVRYRQSGDVEFVGRKDGQVKIRGFRIETKEVESVIRGFDGIKDVTVQAYDYESGGKYLAAFIVSDSETDISRLSEFIKEQKPAYMVPAVIMQIDSIPLTVNQKVDKKALPKPELQKAAYVAPVGKTEEDFCAIFGKVLGIDKVSAEDDFFEIGGSSILAMKVVITAEKEGYSIVYNDVFKYTTPRLMAEHLTGASIKTEKGSSTAAVSADEAGEIPEIGRDGYDYRRIHELLSRNTLEAFKTGERLPINDVLLFGGTGYLGSHVLHELIVSQEGRILCFVRPGKDETGEERLKKTLKYYFDNDFAELFGKRISVIEGDATDPGALKGFKAPSEGMTAINCAASVKHFAKGDEINRVNVESVKNICGWCEDNGARLVHISTGSVLGSRSNNIPPVGYKFDEHRLYAGQVIDNNQYVHSKFMAERHIYEEMLDRGLCAKVLRVGNLAPRDEDGQFQINYGTNNFMNSIKAFKTLGMIGFDMLDSVVEFSPIDYVAKAVLALAVTPEDCVCFMPLNPHRPIFEDIIKVLEEEGFHIRPAEDEEVSEALAAALSDDKKREAVSSLVAYQNSEGDVTEIGLDDATIAHTLHILKRLGFSWPETGEEYIRQFVKKLDEKAFFEA